MPEMTPQERHDAYWRVVAATLPVAMQMSIRPRAGGVVSATSGPQVQAMEMQPEVAAKIALKMAAQVLAEYEVGT